MKSESRGLQPAIELLESRIAPASVLVAHDLNGDVITFKSSLGNIVTAYTASSRLPDNLHTQFILTLDSSFSGANISVTVTKGRFGDGVLPNLIINATGVNLGDVSIDGDLGYIDAGSGSATVPAIKSLSVNSIGRYEGESALLETSNITGSVTKLAIKGDVDGTFFDVSQNIGSISIGGSLNGGGTNKTTDGDLFAGAAIGSVSIGHDVRGGDADYNGIIASTTTLGAVKVGGSIYGGEGTYSGSIGGGSNVTSIAVAGSIIGGAGNYSGDIYGGYNADGTIGKVSLGGSLVGGDGNYSGLIGYSNAGTNTLTLAKVTIGGDIFGGSGEFSGGVWASSSSIQNLALKGSLIGGTNANDFSGFIDSDAAGGVISIGGNIDGGSGQGSAHIGAFGLAKLDIGGSIYGGYGFHSANVVIAGTLGVLDIHGDVIGGDYSYSGSVQATTVTTETIGGVVVPGPFLDSGTVTP